MPQWSTFLSAILEVPPQTAQLKLKGATRPMGWSRSIKLRDASVAEVLRLIENFRVLCFEKHHFSGPRKSVRNCPQG